MNVPLPAEVLSALSDLSCELRKHGLKLDSVTIKPDRPFTTEYAIHTAGGTVKVKHEL